MKSEAGATPALSVLLPVRDGLPYLEECLQSLEDQTFGDFEVIAVDDGSRDGSGELLEKWRRKDPRVRTLRLGRAGLIEALNAGLAACRAPLVARMDADDRCHPERFERQVALLHAQPELDVASCLVSHFPRHLVAEGFRRYEEWLNGLVDHEEILRERFIESPLPHPSVMVRRRVLDDVGGYRDRGWPEDYDLWLRLARRGARFGKVPRTLLWWRDHAARLTRTDSRYAVERFLACKAHHLLEGPLVGVDRVVIWGAGQTGRRISKHLKRGGAPIVGFIDIDDAKIGRTLRGFPIYGRDEIGPLLEPGGLVLSAVSSRGARELIRGRLDRLGLVEGEDYWCVA